MHADMSSFSLRSLLMQIEYGFALLSEMSLILLGSSFQGFREDPA